MAADAFDTALSFVLAQEGGYVDDPLDPGGATNLGITLRVLTNWRHTAVSKQDVQHLGRDEASAIYRAHYWNVLHGDALPAGVDLLVFDCGVNMGTYRSACLLQRSLGVTADGAIGPRTLSAIKSGQMMELIEQLARERQTYYESLPTFSHFGHGWTRRVEAAKKASEELAS